MINKNIFTGNIFCNMMRTQKNFNKHISIPIGKMIRKYREDKGLSTEQVARDGKISKNYLYMLEKGESSPSLQKLEEVCKGLGVSVLDLLGAYYKSKANSDSVESHIKHQTLKIYNKIESLPLNDKKVFMKILDCLTEKGGA